jgi:hypothetical protein
MRIRLGNVSILVRTVVCAYSIAELPASWVQVFRRVERAFARAKLDVRVRLHPLEDLPETFEIVAVAPELRAQAGSVARGARVVALTREDALQVVGDLIREIETGETLHAARVNPDAPKVVVIRGGQEL